MDPVILSPTKQQFNGTTYYLVGGYYTNKWDDPLRLHQRVWKEVNGPIPKRHHIHHINGDTGDNRAENLQCLSPTEHAALHPNTRPFPKACLDAAAAEKRTPEGRARAKTAAQKAAVTTRLRHEKQFVCIQCAKPFRALRSPSGMCDQVCRKRRHAGLPGGATCRRPR